MRIIALLALCALAGCASVPPKALTLSIAWEPPAGAVDDYAVMVSESPIPLTGPYIPTVTVQGTSTVLPYSAPAGVTVYVGVAACDSGACGPIATASAVVP